MHLFFPLYYFVFVMLKRSGVMNTFQYSNVPVAFPPKSHLMPYSNCTFHHCFPLKLPSSLQVLLNCWTFLVIRTVISPDKGQVAVISHGQFVFQTFIILMPNIHEPSLPKTSFASQTDFLPSPPGNGVIPPLSLEKIVIKNSAKTFLSHF